MIERMVLRSVRREHLYAADKSQPQTRHHIVAGVHAKSRLYFVGVTRMSAIKAENIRNYVMS